MPHQIVTMSIKKWYLNALLLLTICEANCEKLPTFKCTGSDLLTDLSGLISGFGHHPAENPWITLRLHTKAHVEGNSYVPYKINVKGDVVDLKSYGFDPNVKTIVLIHGYEANGKADWLQRMKDAFLTYDTVNLIIVDWGVFAKKLDYHEVASKTVVVASQVAKLLVQIERKYPPNTTWTPLYLIGHSLGAHVAGMIARNLKTMNSKWMVARITGLDPAFPCFDGNPLALSRDDARYVDVLHTTGNAGYGTALGIIGAVGHVDIYMNGAVIQLPCLKPGSSAWDLIEKAKEIKCSHGESHEYFTESINIAAEKIPNAEYIDATMWDKTYEDAERIIHSGGCNHVSQCKYVGIHSNLRGDDGVYFAISGCQSPFYIVNNVDRETVLAELKPALCGS